MAFIKHAKCGSLSCLMQAIRRCLELENVPPLPNLSCDLSDNYESILKAECDYFCREGHLDTERLRHYPSILFGLETAILSLKATKENVLFDTSFTRSECGIPINGLVWMGSFTEMMQRLERKLDEGFRCSKA